MRFKLEFELFDGTCMECPAFRELDNNVNSCYGIWPFRKISANEPRPEWCPLEKIENQEGEQNG